MPEKMQQNAQTLKHTVQIYLNALSHINTNLISFIVF